MHRSSITLKRLIHYSVTLLLLCCMSGVSTLIACLTLCSSMVLAATPDESSIDRMMIARLMTANSPDTDSRKDLITAPVGQACSMKQTSACAGIDSSKSCCKKQSTKVKTTDHCQSSSNRLSSAWQITIKPNLATSAVITPTIGMERSSQLDVSCSLPRCCCLPFEPDGELPQLPRVGDLRIAALDSEFSTTLPNAFATSRPSELIRPPRLINNEGTYLRCCILLI